MSPDPSLRQELENAKHEHRIKIAELENAHKLAMKEKEFELKHFKDEEVQGLKAQVNEKETKIQVLEKENEMLTKITNLNADIIDIKDLVANLIGKLPEIKFSNLTVGGGKSE